MNLLRTIYLSVLSCLITAIFIYLYLFKMASNNVNNMTTYSSIKLSSDTGSIRNKVKSSSAAAASAAEHRKDIKKLINNNNNNMGNYVQQENKNQRKLNHYNNNNSTKSYQNYFIVNKSLCGR